MNVSFGVGVTFGLLATSPRLSPSPPSRPVTRPIHDPPPMPTDLGRVAVDLVTEVVEAHHLLLVLLEWVLPGQKLLHVGVRLAADQVLVPLVPAVCT